ncbi:MAG: HD domain-containing protein, partial [Gammaproteobacteria bacterium]|nr:HD domain-containing protein [candidate division Zixibacteria bacterium]NIR92358.1 HD domain-containing protein [Gammaproteobacteria bacterium]NIT56732.1 HD domain-containing protein [Fodinibius sp.]NIR63784.1 HD domain-containing protein [candidate division Zixibacteria bacterium]NIS45742.1 HD domain-containing protein [candidate division Zixibacteria bacterium]
VYLLAMFLWSISAFMSVSGLVEVLPWFRIMVISPIVMMLAIFYFVQTLLFQRSQWFILVILYGLISSYLILFTDLLLSYAYLDQNGALIYEFSPLVYIIASIGYFLMIYSLVKLVRGMQETESPDQRNRFRYLIIGLGITVIASAVNFTALGRYPIDIAANAITAILISYAIMRYHLLDIRLVIRAGLAYSLMTTILGILYYLIITVFVNLFQFMSGSELLFASVVVALLTGIFLNQLRERAQTAIDRIFYRQRYNAGIMLQEISQTTATVLDLDKITGLILDAVVDTIHVLQAAIYIKNLQKEDYQVIAFSSPENLRMINFRLEHPVVRWLTEYKQVLYKHQLSDSPYFKSLWGRERDDIDEFGVELFIPLIAKNELVGILVIGQKKMNQHYTNDDVLTLTTLANQTAIAIENARLYDDLENTFVETVVTLANAIDLRDTYTSNHSQQIATLAAEVANRMGLDEKEIDAVYWGGLLHDIGKIGIPDSILQKPGKLNEKEWELMRRHPALGAELVSKIKRLQHIAPIIGSSHEMYDGSGYPEGLKGDEIPIGARIVTVVDAYSAMIDKR